MKDIIITKLNKFKNIYIEYDSPRLSTLNDHSDIDIQTYPTSQQGQHMCLDFLNKMLMHLSARYEFVMNRWKYNIFITLFLRINWCIPSDTKYLLKIVTWFGNNI
jgi:hypothetical protein